MEHGFFDTSNELKKQSYYAERALNQSRLKTILISPKFYDEYPVKKETKALSLGTLIHSYLETGSLDNFIIMPKFRRTKEALEEKAAWLEANVEKYVCTEDQMEAIHAAAASVERNGTVKQLLSISQKEVGCIAELHGHKCKGMLDLVSTEGNIIADIKTTRRHTTYDFSRDCVEYGTPFQLAFYRMLYKQTTGRWPMVAIIVVETLPPYDLTLYWPSYSFIEFGNERVEQAFKILDRCLENGHFPGKQTEIGGMPLELPRWAYNRIVS